MFKFTQATSIKKWLLTLSLTVLSLLVICLCACNSAGLTKEQISEYIGTDNYPTETTQISYSIDVENLQEVVGDSDYVIVAEVTGYVETTYSASGFPLTEYSIQVVENIKGTLDTSREINLLKEGGLNEENSAFVVYENDFLPQVGGTYIFCLYGQSSGAIRACGQNYTLKIENPSDYKNEENYINILSAYENEIVSSRTRYQSQYEVK